MSRTLCLIRQRMMGCSHCAAQMGILMEGGNGSTVWLMVPLAGLGSSPNVSTRSGGGNGRRCPRRVDWVPFDTDIESGISPNTGSNPVLITMGKRYPESSNQDFKNDSAECLRREWDIMGIKGTDTIPPSSVGCFHWGCPAGF